MSLQASPAWSLVLPLLPRLGTAFLTSLVISGVDLAQPFLLKIAIDDYLMRDLSGVGWVVLAYGGSVVISVVLKIARASLLHTPEQCLVAEVRRRVHALLLRKPMPYFQTTLPGELVSRTVNDVERIGAVSATAVLGLVEVVSIMAIAVILFRLSVPMAIITMAFVPLVVLCMCYYGSKINVESGQERDSDGQLVGFVEEQLKARDVVRSLGKAHVVVEQFQALNTRHQASALRSAILQGRLDSSVQAVGLLATASVIFAAMVLRGQSLTVGIVAAFVLYVPVFFGPIRQLAEKWGQMQQGLAAVERLQSLRSPAPCEQSIRLPTMGDQRLDLDKGLTNTQTPEAPPPVVAFRGVTFGYPCSSETVLHDVSFEVRAGERIALLGTTGSGKSTLVRLLTRLYEPPAAQVFIEGKDVSTVSAETIRFRVGVVPQRTLLFNGTVADNLKIGLGESGQRYWFNERRDELESILGSRLPLLLDVGENGHRLSAGQRQIVALVRVLLRRPVVLVLDEATSLMDPAQERDMAQKLLRWVSVDATVVIAHRLQPEWACDRVVLLRHGRVEAVGEHRELVARNAYYRGLLDRSSSTRPD